jgi:hypothetical protein
LWWRRRHNYRIHCDNRNHSDDRNYSDNCYDGTHGNHGNHGNHGYNCDNCDNCDNRDNILYCRWNCRIPADECNSLHTA